MGAAMLLRAVRISNHKRNATDEHLSSALQCAIDRVLNGAPCIYQLWQDKVLDVCNSEQTSRCFPGGASDRSGFCCCACLL